MTSEFAAGCLSAATLRPPTLFDDPVALVCNEEGKVYGSCRCNRARARTRTAKSRTAIAGPFFVCGLGEDDFCSLPKELQGKYVDMFRWPEKFLGHWRQAWSARAGQAARGGA